MGQGEYQSLKGRATSRRQFTFVATSLSNMICINTSHLASWLPRCVSVVIRNNHFCLVVFCCSTSLVLDSFNKYGLYVAIAIRPETKHTGGLATLSKTSSKQAKRVSALVRLVSTKKWIKNFLIIAMGCK